MNSWNISDVRNKPKKGVRSWDVNVRLPDRLDIFLHMTVRAMNMRNHQRTRRALLKAPGRKRQNALTAMRGLWKKRQVDAVAYQQKIRREAERMKV